MAATPFSERLRFLDADDLDDSDVDFATLDVHGSDDRDLGDLEGFIVDTDSGRVVYAVVDSGGWFRSRHFAVPIGHAQLDAGRRRLNVNVTREAAEKLPAFNPKELRRFSDDEMRAFEQRTAIVCCPDDPTDVSGAVQYDRIRHYAQPDWWRADYQRVDRYQDLDRWDVREREAGENRANAAARERERSRDEYNREHVTAREREEDRTRSADDVSPHFEGRAQPGDVIGIETGGESTHVGDTAADEDERRRRR
ncbi:MAG TPA: PRC-barrel domain-containing protein [Vicinamibacterales bacterium]|nr:PRC-barrel domain-containing protein [Vicinamibacterales bacterium]